MPLEIVVEEGQAVEAILPGYFLDGLVTGLDRKFELGYDIIVDDHFCTLPRDGMDYFVQIAGSHVHFSCIEGYRALLSVVCHEQREEPAEQFFLAGIEVLSTVGIFCHAVEAYQEECAQLHDGHLSDTRGTDLREQWLYDVEKPMDEGIEPGIGTRKDTLHIAFHDALHLE